MELLEVVLKWVVAPVALGVLHMYRVQQQHSTKLAVLAAVHEANKEAHDREFKEVRESFKRVFEKLDNIEGALRK
jgi:hypothetical protein